MNPLKQIFARSYNIKWYTDGCIRLLYPTLLTRANDGVWRQIQEVIPDTSAWENLKIVEGVKEALK